MSKASVGSTVYGASSPGNCRTGTPATKPHAVQQAGSSAYSYDCNGNMTGRTVGGVTYSLVYDAENRLQQVKQGSTVLASYTYDADGNRVKAVIGSSKLGGFLPRITRIDTKAEARFVQISEIRGRESRPDFRHELHELTRRQKLDSCK
ncbi:MAG: hypothetical protein WBR35_05970 [Anaerolineae bacterium]